MEYPHPVTIFRTCHMIKLLREVFSPHMVKKHIFWKVPIIIEIWNNILRSEGVRIKVFKIQKRVLQIIGGLGKIGFVGYVLKIMASSRSCHIY
jgi:hypothetical protein